MAMDFPIGELMDEDACYAWLVSSLHPAGLACPACRARAADGRLTVHRRRPRRPSVPDHRCLDCRRVFNAFAGTALAGTHRQPSALVLVLRGVATGEPTAALARQLKCSRPHLLGLRHRLQANLAAALPAADPAALAADAAVEADEMYQAAGEKRPAAPGPRRPAAAAGEQTTRSRDLRQRPPAGPRRRRPRHRPAAA